LPTPTSLLCTIMYFSPSDVTSTKEATLRIKSIDTVCCSFPLIVSPDILGGMISVTRAPVLILGEQSEIESLVADSYLRATGDVGCRGWLLNNAPAAVER
jgi:hypothetical protein